MDAGREFIDAPEPWTPKNALMVAHLLCHGAELGRRPTPAGDSLRGPQAWPGLGFARKPTVKNGAARSHEIGGLSRIFPTLAPRIETCCGWYAFWHGHDPQRVPQKVLPRHSRGRA